MQCFLHDKPFIKSKCSNLNACSFKICSFNKCCGRNFYHAICGCVQFEQNESTNQKSVENIDIPTILSSFPNININGKQCEHGKEFVIMVCTQANPCEKKYLKTLKCKCFKPLDATFQSCEITPIM